MCNRDNISTVLRANQINVFNGIAGLAEVKSDQIYKDFMNANIIK